MVLCRLVSRHVTSVYVLFAVNRSQHACREGFLDPRERHHVVGVRHRPGQLHGAQAVALGTRQTAEGREEKPTNKQVIRLGAKPSREEWLDIGM